MQIDILANDTNYDANRFDNNFNFFNMFLTNFNISVESVICSRIPSGKGQHHMESSPPIFNLLICFYMVGDFPGGYSQTDCNFNFNTNVKVAVEIYVNSSINTKIFTHYSFIYILETSVT